jgi:hypothetical protein|eukprot:COSAG01_NODE_436_length_17063_cov_42.157628_13_plen_52_part_00
MSGDADTDTDVIEQVGMIDAAIDADEIEVDTKWRTNEDKGCTIADTVWLKS